MVEERGRAPLGILVNVRSRLVFGQYAGGVLDQVCKLGIAEEGAHDAVDVDDGLGRELARKTQRLEHLDEMARPNLLDPHRADDGQNVLAEARLFRFGIGENEAALTDPLLGESRDRDWAGAKRYLLAGGYAVGDFVEDAFRLAFLADDVVGLRRHPL